MTMTPEPRGKLGAMATQQVATAIRSRAVVYGPEDDVLVWDAVGWRAAEDDVRRLRQRIFTASQVGDLKRVRNL
jgi:RNA-directed DNA polymerase